MRNPWSLAAASLLLLSTSAAASEEAVAVILTNSGPESLRCQWQLAHWMTAEALALPPGGQERLTVWREDSGALFLRQGDEPRPFHIEGLLCGPEQGFGDQPRQVDLSALRRDRADGLAVTCSAAAQTDCQAIPLP